MHEVRVHGRGGQGAVTAAELLSVAAVHAGQRAQAFPSFGEVVGGLDAETALFEARRCLRAGVPLRSDRDGARAGLTEVSR